MITINLRPGARRAVKRGAAFAGMGGRFKEMTSGVKDPWQMAAAAAWAVVVLGLGFLFITTSAKAASLTPQIEEARLEHDRYQGFLREKRREELSRDSILSQIGTISAIDRDRYVWPHILDEVNDALPDNTWLTEVATLAGSGANAIPGDAPPPVIRIQGRTGDLANYTAFLRRLEASPWLMNVLPIQAQTVIEGNRPLTAFTIQATFSQADSSVVRTTPILESVVED
jgi:Tfp pilus assembly protein PilN